MADNIMSFEDYLELIKRLRLDGLDKSKVDQATDKVLKVLDEFAKKINTTKDGKVEADVGYDLLDAVADMQDPETYSKIMDLLNEKLAKDGDIYNISTPEDKMLGLANRYVTRAQEARYNRNWKLFGFYLRSLAYFVPLLIEKARMREETVMQKIESGFAALQAAPQETVIPEDINDRAKFLIKKNSLPLKYYPVLYMANPNRKLEYFAFMKPGYKNIDFYTFVKNKQQSVETSENLMEFRKQFKYYYRPEVLNKLKNKYKDFYKPEVLELMGPSIKVIWQDPALEIYTGKAIEDPEVEAAIETAAHISRDKLKQDLKVKFKLAADNAEQIDRKVKNGLYIKAEDFHKASRPYIIENYIESKGWYLSPYDKDYMLILED